MVQAQGNVFVVVPVYGKGRVNDGWIEGLGGGEKNEPWNSSRETLLPGSVKATRKPGAGPGKLALCLCVKIIQKRPQICYFSRLKYAIVYKDVTFPRVTICDSAKM